MKHIIIKYPDGDMSLEKIEKDINLFDFKFLRQIVHVLINKIVEQDSITQQYEFNINKINNIIDNCWEQKSMIQNNIIVKKPKVIIQKEEK